MKKVEILKHGDQWIDTKTPAVCPECASLEVKEYVNNSTHWAGPFKILHTKKECQCEICHCRFLIGKEEKSINDVSWEELFGYIAGITFLIFIVLIVITAGVWHDRDWPPIQMTIAIISDLIICVLSFLGWIICSC